MKKKIGHYFFPCSEKKKISAYVAYKLHLQQKESEKISRDYAIADEYWKSVLAERERKAAIIKAQKHLADFRRGKIAGVLV